MPADSCAGNPYSLPRLALPPGTLVPGLKYTFVAASVSASLGVTTTANVTVWATASPLVPKLSLANTTAFPASAPLTLDASRTLDAMEPVYATLYTAGGPTAPSLTFGWDCRWANGTGQGGLVSGQTVSAALDTLSQAFAGEV